MAERRYEDDLANKRYYSSGEVVLSENIKSFLSKSNLIIPKHLFNRFHELVSKFSIREGKLDLELAKENVPYILSLFNLVRESGVKRYESRDIFLVANEEKSLYSTFIEDAHERDPEFALNVLRLLPLLFKEERAVIRENDLKRLMRDGYNVPISGLSSGLRESSLSKAYFDSFKGIAEIDKEVSLKFLKKIDHLNDWGAARYSTLIKNLSAKDSTLVSKVIDLPADIALELNDILYSLDSSTLNFCVDIGYDAYKKYRDGFITGRKIFSIPKQPDFTMYSKQLIKIKHLDIFEELLPKLHFLTEKFGPDSTRSYIDAVGEVAKLNKELGLEFARSVYDLLDVFDVNNVNFYIENLLDISQKNMGVVVDAAKTLAFFMPKQDDLRFISDRICSLSSLDDAIVLEFMKNSPLIFNGYNRGMVEIYSEAIKAANETGWRTAYMVAKEFPSFIKSYINEELPLEGGISGNGAYLFLSTFIKSNIAKETTKRDDIYERFLGPLVGTDKFDAYFKEILADKLSQNICNNLKTYDDVLRISSIVNLDLITNLKNIIVKLNKFYGSRIMPDVLRTAKKSNDLEAIIKNLASVYHADELEIISGNIAEKRNRIPFMNASEEKDKIIYRTEERKMIDDFDLIFIVLLGSLIEKGILREGEMRVNNVNCILNSSFQIGAPSMQDVFVRLKKEIVPPKSELEMLGIPQAYLKEIYSELASPHKLIRYAKLSFDALRKFKDIDKIDVVSNIYFDKVKYAKLTLDLMKKEIPSLVMSIHTFNKKGMEKTLKHNKNFNNGHFSISSMATPPGEKYNDEERITLFLRHPYDNLNKIKSLESVIFGGLMDEHQLAFNLYNRVKEAEAREYIVRNIDFDVMNAFFSFSNDLWKRNSFLRICGKGKQEQFKLLKRLVRRQ